MKLYRIASPTANPELVELSTESGPVESIELGESGRGRSRNIIPITGVGAEIRAKKVDDMTVLVRGDWDSEERCLVVINYTGAYQKNRSYRIHNAEGLTTLVSGRVAFGIAGRAGSGGEVLAIVDSGAVFRLTSKYASKWYMWDGQTWITETPEERNARLALIKVEQGGGEWL